MLSKRVNFAIFAAVLAGIFGVSGFTPTLSAQQTAVEALEKAKVLQRMPEYKAAKGTSPCSILRGRNRCLIIGSLVTSVVSLSISTIISGSITVLVPLAPLTVEYRVPLRRTLADARSATSVSRVLTAN